MRSIFISIVAGLLILFTIIGLNYLIFGDQTNEDSYKPLIIIVPVMGIMLWYLIYKTSKK